MTRGLRLTAVLVTLGGAAAVFGARRVSRAAAGPMAPAAQAESAQGPDRLLTERTKGDQGAPITFYEIADFQCPACRVFFEETLPHLLTEYVDAGKMRIVFINFPILQLHANAAAAHELAMCAARQNRFWAMHDLLYRNQERWASLDNPRAFFLALADSAALAPDAVTRCLAGGDTRALVLAEAQSAFQAGVRSTPSFIVEGGLVAGAAPIEAWRPILDSIYTAKTGTR